MDVCKQAIIYLTDLNTKYTNKFTVIFDIDGTLIKDENYCITPVIDLYNHVLSLGYYIFIITARLRSPDNIYYTINMLKNCGIDKYTGLLMRPAYENDPYKYKENQRKFIYNSGYDIIMSVGDMDFDFGAYGGVSVKII